MLGISYAVMRASIHYSLTLAIYNPNLTAVGSGIDTPIDGSSPKNVTIDWPALFEAQFFGDPQNTNPKSLVRYPYKCAGSLLIFCTQALDLLC